MAPKLSGFSSSLCPQSQLPSDTWPAQSWSCQTSEQKLPASPYLHCTLPYSHPHCCHKICLLTPPGMLINAFILLFNYSQELLRLKEKPSQRCSCAHLLFRKLRQDICSYQLNKGNNKIRKHTSFAFLVPWLWEWTSPVHRGLKKKSLSRFKPTHVTWMDQVW